MAEPTSTWGDPISTHHIEEETPAEVKFGDVCVIVQGPPEKVKLAWSALVLLQVKLKGRLDPEAVIRLIKGRGQKVGR